MPARMEDGCGLHGVPWTKMQLTDKRLSFSWARSAHASWQISKSRPKYRPRRTARSFLTKPRIIDGVRAWRVGRDAVGHSVELNTVRMFEA